MRCSTLGFGRIVFRVLTVTLIALASQTLAVAADGTWTNLGGGDYNTPGNWQGNTVASGAGFTANFNTLDITTDIEVMLNQPLTIGEMIFGDTNLGTGGSWGITTTSLETAIITLDNGGAKPVITVNQLTPAMFDDTFLGNSLAGTMGFEKAGPGILNLGPGTMHTITGGIDITGGTLRMQSAVPGQTITLSNGATLETAVTLDANTGHTISIPSGQEGSITTTATAELGNFSAAGATLNLHIATSGATLTADGDWAIGGSPAEVNVSSVDGTGFLRLRPNSGSPNFNTGTAFANTLLNLDNVTVWTRTNSGGNDVNIGALSGTSTAVIAGGAQGGGTAPRYIIGALNTDTEYAGSFTSDAALPAPEGGLHIVKVGTGTLTLSGTLSNSPRVAGSADTHPWRRGGVTQIQDGTIALTGSTVIPGGVDDETFGELISTIEVQTNGRLDVTGYTAGDYGTQPLQQIIGSGNLDYNGTWQHSQGIIRPGDSAPNLGNVANFFDPNTTQVAGTITFNGNLNLSGGDIGYDVSLDPNSGNDLVHVTGAATVSGGTVVPRFFAGIPAEGTYTVLTADGGVSGNIGNLIIDFPGRGDDPLAFIEGNSIKFSATDTGGSADLVWTGANGAVWDVETTQAWTNEGSPDVFFNLDNVEFPNNPVSTTVNIAQSVSPSSIVLNNTSAAYTFMSTGGSITGTTDFTKTGAGNLTMQVSNSYNGPTSLGGGTIDIGATATPFGVGTMAIDGVTIIGTTAGGLGSTALTATGTNTIQMEGNAGSGNTFGLPNISGSGELTITTAVPDKWFALGNTSDYEGTLNLVGVDGNTPIHVRLVANSGFNVLNMNDARISVRSGTGGGTNTMPIGELHGDENTVLRAFEGGSPAVNAIWQIGANNTDSDFAGVIEDGGGSGGTTSVSHVQKVGTGTLTLTGANTYTGDTIIDAGTLSINTPFLANTSDVFIADGAFFNLTFGGANDINFLYLGGEPVAPGLYGAGNSMGRITGSGMLNVLFEGPELGLDGDYNDDGVVNAADYVVWRNNEGTTNVLPNDPTGGTIGQAQYDLWVANFGQTAGPGAGSGSQAIPEPATAAILLVALCGLMGIARRR